MEKRDKQVIVRLTTTEKDALNQLAKRTGISQSTLMRSILKDYIKNNL